MTGFIRESAKTTRSWPISFFGRILALASVPVVFGACAPPAPEPPDLACRGCSLALISVDTLRADHLGCYGYPRDTSPHLDRFAASGVLFEAASAPSYHTADSHMSVFTSTFPSVHRVRNARGGRDTAGLSRSIPTFVEHLRAAGFRTAGFHGGGNVSGPYGFDRGFEIYRPTLDDLTPALPWLQERARNPSEPFFLFLHTYRTHDPYLPDPRHDLWGRDYQGAIFSDPASFESALEVGDFAERRELFWSRVDRNRPEDVQKLQDLYDGEIHQVDEDLRPLLEALTHLPQRVLVVVVSDHGEEFFEHGGHLHDALYEETLHVPMIVRHPDGVGAGTRIADRVSLVDLAPTLLDALGLAPLSAAQGRSLLPAIRAGRSNSRPVLSEKVVGDAGPVLGPAQLNQALYLGTLKLIASPDGARRLFDLASDPREGLDLSSRPESDLLRLTSILDRRNAINRDVASSRRSPSGDAPVDLDAATLERLRALGYL